MNAHIYAHGPNLIDYNATDTDKGYVSDKYLSNTGSRVDYPGWSISEYIDVSNLSHLKVNITGNTANAASICYYDNTKTFISGTAYAARELFGEVIPEDTKYIRFSYPDSAQANGWEVYDPKPKWRETKGYQYTHGENVVPPIREANGWRVGYRTGEGNYVTVNTQGEWLSPKIDLPTSRKIKIVINNSTATVPSMSIYWWNGDTFLFSSSTTEYEGATYTAPAGATKFDFAFRAGSDCKTEEEIIANDVEAISYDTTVGWREATAHEYSSGSWD